MPLKLVSFTGLGIGLGLEVWEALIPETIHKSLEETEENALEAG